MLPSGPPLSVPPAKPRPRRRVAAIAAAVLGSLALLAVAAPMAQAQAVDYASDFDAPGIPVGGTNEAYIDCVNDVGTDVTVTVTDPASVTTDHLVKGTGAASNSPGRVFVEVGPSGLFAATQVGTYSATVKCTGFDPYTTTFEAVAPTLGLSIAVDTDYDCTTPETAYLVGDRDNLCYTITNNTGQDIRRMGLVRPTSVGFEYPLAGEFPAGASQTFGANAGNTIPFDGTTLGGLYVWAEIGSENSGVFAASAIKSIDVPALPAPLALTTTTGLSAATACADTGGLVDRTVDPGTAVYVCYRVTNTSGIPYGSHGLADTTLGSLLTFFPFDLQAGASYDYVVPAPVTMTDSSSYTGTWSALDIEEYSPMKDYVAEATATATVEVTPAVEDETVPTTTPITPTTTDEAAVAAVVSTTPAFTG